MILYPVSSSGPKRTRHSEQLRNQRTYHETPSLEEEERRRRSSSIKTLAGKGN